MKYLLLTISILTAVLLVTAGILVYSSYRAWLDTRPEVIRRLDTLKANLERYDSRQVSLSPALKQSGNTVLYDKRGLVVDIFSYGRRRIVGMAAVPSILAKTVILMEDRKFYEHGGFDIRRIAGALLADIRTLSFSQGGSTITQQLAKILFTDSRKTIRRKLYELFCTLEIEKRFSKDEILALYLNAVNMGHNNYGIQNGSRFYFSKDIFDLNEYETALLVGLLPGPSYFSPLLHPAVCRRKQTIVLNRMESFGLLGSPRDISDGLDEFWRDFTRLKHPPSTSYWNTEKNEAGYFTEYVRVYLEEVLGEDAMKRGDLHVYSTIDLEMQRIAEQTLSEGIELLTGEEGEPGNPEGALIAVDAHSGNILAMVGGSGFSYGNQFNRAVDAYRQAGSAFKPFVYAGAIEEGYSADTVFTDRPLEIETDSGIWRPSNYNDVYYGPVTLEFALHKSLNSVAVQLMAETGPGKTISITGEALDLDEKERDGRFEPYISSALGVYSFSPLEMARLYSIFPNRGEKIFPYAVRRVERAGGEVLLDNEGMMKKKRARYDLENRLRVISPETAAEVDRMLAGVLKRGGTGYRAVVSSGLTINARGKTGTTNGFTDAWFIGYNDEVTASVWVGFDDPAFSLGEGQSGGVVAAPIWAEFMNRSQWRNE